MLPGLQRLSYAGKNFEDSARSLEQCVARPKQRSAASQPAARCGVYRAALTRAPRRYGVAYWHNKFPHWPIVIRRH